MQLSKQKLAKPQPLADWELELAARAAASLYKFVKLTWHLVVQRWPFVDGWHIKAICDHLQAVTEGKILRLLINVPPRHSKSLIVSVFWPAWEWIREQRNQWLFCSRTQSVSLRDNRYSRELIESAFYQSRWPVEMARDQNTKGLYINLAGGLRQATSAGSLSGTGLNADRMVVDDLHAINDTEEQILRDVTWCEETFWTRGNSSEAAMVVIGQRVRANDISGHIITTQPGGPWTILCLPMEYEPHRACETGLVSQHFPEGFKDPRTSAGELLWMARYTQKWVDDYRTNRPGAHARLNQQNPTPSEGGIIKKAWLTKQFDHIDLAKVTKWGTSCDTPFKKGKNTDFFVIQLIAQIGMDYYVVAQRRARMSFAQMKDEYKGFIDKWMSLGIPITKNLIEAAASGEQIMSVLADEIRMVPFKPGRDSKEQRFEAASDTFRAGHVLYPSPKAVLIKDGRIIHHVLDDWVGGWKEELGTVPLADHDDQADATCQYILDDQRNKRPAPSAALAKPEIDVHAQYERPGSRWRGGGR